MPENQIDHKDRNRKNNRIENLRLATASQNCVNRPSRRKNGTPRGVCWHKGQNKWTAKIEQNGKKIWLGTFDSAETARLAYIEASKKIHGEFSTLD